MNRMLKRIALGGVVTLLCLNVGQALAQQGGGGGRGNFDPEQMRQRMMDRYKEAFGVTNEDEWKLISERITKVNEARRDVGFGGGMGMMGRRPAGPGGDQAGGGQDRQRRFGGEPDPDAEALQKAIDSKASNDELKAKMTAYRTSRKAKQTKLLAAQEDLRKVLSVRQEAVALQMNLVD
jgi:hypothetical protein